MCSESDPGRATNRKKQSFSVERVATRRKRMKVAHGEVEKCDAFDALPDDLVLSILCKLSASAGSPADLINAQLTCKRMRSLGMHSIVLEKASMKALTFRARNWSENAHRFLKMCSDSGNVEASYTLGMIRFYVLENRASGASLMAKAAINSHAPSLYSLAIIQFNGSGGSKSDKDLRAGAALCARASFLGHVDALRELGHCLQDGYGVRQNIVEGRRFLVQANARELAAVMKSQPVRWQTEVAAAESSPCSLLSDFGCDVQPPEVHPANRFLTEWFAARGGDLGAGLRMCSNQGCGRPETRNHEFRRCSICGVVNYCSRACQALDWKLRHKTACVPVGRWNIDGAVAGGGDNGPADHLVEQS
uniref:MYND-type domain-containing protein n=1 Tax=Kalanchoe fedtschenkoi TaxID=63787 RepID=A0A7N0TXE8_KALFE